MPQVRKQRASQASLSFYCLKVFPAKVCTGWKQRHSVRGRGKHLGFDPQGDEIGGIQEFKPWNPHKAEKDVEVGDFYFKQKNYRAALDRYREALYYKDNDAVATFRIAVCQEKLGDFTEARQAYGAYLKILPHGPFAGEARQALDRLKSENAGPDSSPDARAPR